MEKTFFNYIILLAFKEKLYLENKKQINLIQLHNFRLQVIKNLKNFFNRNCIFSDSELEEKINDFFDSNSVSMRVERNLYDTFVDKYNDFFEYKNGNIVIKEDIFNETYYSFISSYEKINFSDTNETFLKVIKKMCISRNVLDSINVDSFKYEISNLLDIEESIRRAYSLKDESVLTTVITSYNKYIKSKFYDLLNLNDDDFNRYEIMFNARYSDLDKNDLDVSKKNYYLYDSSNKFLKAIFNSNNLSVVCLNDCISNIKKLRNKEEIDLNDSDLVFYSKYIEYLNNNNLDSSCNEEMYLVKSNLRYVLNSYRHDSPITDIEIKNYLDSMYDFDSFEDKYILSEMFLREMLYENIDCDKSMLKKTIFVSTYYDLTRDKRIKLIVDSNINSRVGKALNEVLINHDYSYFLNNISIKQKNLYNKYK